MHSDLSPALKPFILQGYAFPAMGEHVYMPVTPRGFFGLSSQKGQDVVGDVRYLPRIRAVLDEWRADGERDGQLLAMLLLEQTDPEAVRIDLFYCGTVATCGYLPVAQAATFAAPIRATADQGLIVAIAARASGGTTEDPAISIRLG
ncbi:hypothetical protein [Okibacterium endophyticum]